MSIKTKNILRNIGFLLSIPVLIGAFVFAVAEDRLAQVLAVEVQISNPALGFVTQSDVESAVRAESIIMNGSSIDKINVAQLEDRIQSNPWVEDADVFITSNQHIKVKLKQVVPKLRVQRMDSSANGYYLDANGYMIPLSRKFVADLPILTAQKSITTVEQRKELVDFAQFIEQDTFWQATISQINLDKANDIELSSIIGNTNIRFGSVANKEDKFNRLFQFYQKGINRINWSNVRELDLRFDKQLVCRRYHKEKHIEDSKSPSLYVKTKTKPTVIKKQVAKKKVSLAKKTTVKKSDILIPKRRKVVSKKVWKQDEVAQKKVAKKVTAKQKKKKVVSKKKRVAKKVKTKVATAKKKKTKKKIVAKTKTASKTAKRTIKKSAPQPKKKKREIIINTEPVTKK
jgi:cell division protein FtsQ